MLALLLDEPGAAAIEAVLEDGAIIGTVNLSEVIAKLSDSQDEGQIQRSLQTVKFETAVFSEDDAWQTGMLRSRTRSLGLSLGDRACLALALSLGLPVLTADRIWAQLDLGVEVVLCR
jgi:PIN domain nuclease of toxin-antitoxin system